MKKLVGNHNYKLNEVYKSKNVIFQERFSSQNGIPYSLEPKFSTFINKEIKLQNRYNEYLDSYFQKINFMTKKLSIH